MKTLLVAMFSIAYATHSLADDKLIISNEPPPELMMTFDDAGKISGDWDAVRKCAAGKIDLSDGPPSPRPGDSDFIKKYDTWHAWEIQANARMRISEFCRIAISARHAGYLEGQKTPDAPDAFAPIPWGSNFMK